MSLAAVTDSASPKDDVVERPKPVWWCLILGGLTVLALQAFDTSFYTWWTSTMHPLPGQHVMLWILIACVPIHVFEAVYVYRLARQMGMIQSSLGWALQTFMLGYPSTYLMRKRARAQNIIP